MHLGFAHGVFHVGLLLGGFEDFLYLGQWVLIHFHSLGLDLVDN
jgi:hypothetical protein